MNLLGILKSSFMAFLFDEKACEDIRDSNWIDVLLLYGLITLILVIVGPLIMILFNPVLGFVQLFNIIAGIFFGVPFAVTMSFVITGYFHIFYMLFKSASGKYFGTYKGVIAFSTVSAIINQIISLVISALIFYGFLSFMMIDDDLSADFLNGFSIMDYLGIIILISFLALIYFIYMTFVQANLLAKIHNISFIRSIFIYIFAIFVFLFIIFLFVLLVFLLIYSITGASIY